MGSFVLRVEGDSFRVLQEIFVRSFPTPPPSPFKNQMVSHFIQSLLLKTNPTLINFTFCFKLSVTQTLKLILVVSLTQV